MKKLFYLPLFLFMFLTLTSCQKSRMNADLASISGPTWRLFSWEENKVKKDLYPEGLPFIKFTKDGQVSGSTGCNAWNSNIIIEGSDISFFGGSISQVGCSKEKMEIELKMMQGIYSSDKLFKEGNTLIFIQDDKVLLRFKK